MIRILLRLFPKSRLRHWLGHYYIAFYEALFRAFSWKVRRRIKYDRNPLLITMQDKCQTKEYAAARGVKTPETFYMTDDPADIPFDDLPATCLIKASHTCGDNILRLDSSFYLFKDGRYFFNADGTFADREKLAAFKLTREEVLAYCRGWLNRKFEEWAYFNMEPKILVEEVVHPPGNKELTEYKLFTFDGTVKAIQVITNSYRRRDEKVFFDRTWNLFDFTNCKIKLPDPLPPKPAGLEEMIRIGERVGADIDFIRVDLLETERGFMLGELTIYPESGAYNGPSGCPKFNRWLGDQWKRKGVGKTAAVVRKRDPAKYRPEAPVLNE